MCMVMRRFTHFGTPLDLPHATFLGGMHHGEGVVVPSPGVCVCVCVCTTNPCLFDGGRQNFYVAGIGLGHRAVQPSLPSPEKGPAGGGRSSLRPVRGRV